MFDKEKQLQARIKLSQEILKFQEGKKDVLLQLATSTGKSFNFLNIVASLNPESILFVVPQSTMIDNFVLDVKKLGFEWLLPKMQIICYASLKKYIGKSFTVIGLDEAHSLYSDTRMAIIGQINAEKRILLSATIDGTTKAKLDSGFNLHTFECGYEEGVRRGILPELEMEVYSIGLDDTEKKYLHKFKDQKSPILLTASQYYKVLDNKVKAASDKWKDREEFKGDPQWLFNRMLRAGGDRQAWLGEYKTEVLRQTIEELGSSRMLIFCASVDQAKRLGGELSVSSENTPSINRKIIHAFNRGETNRIFSKGMLIEGMNMENTPYAIVCGLGSKELKATQQIGRTLRHDSPKMIVLVVAGTVDEKFLENSFKVNIYGERL